MRRVYVPSFQTKALMVSPLHGNNFGINQSNYIVGLASMLRQSWVLVCLICTCLLKDGINKVPSILPCYMILRFGENMPQCLKNVWGTLTLWLAKIFFLKWKGQLQNQQPIPPPPDQYTTQGYKNVASWIYLWIYLNLSDFFLVSYWLMCLSLIS